MTRRRCKDCPATSGRPAPHPGPRCATHHREARARATVAAHARRVEQTYNISIDLYWAMYDAQGRTCAICQRATGATRRLAVDHDHACCPTTPTCGRCVRGLLCKPCNRMLGHLRDDPKAFSRAAIYLIYPTRRRCPD